MTKQICITDKVLPKVDLLIPKHALRPMRIQLLETFDLVDPDGNIITRLYEEMISDGASVPIFFHRIFPPFGMYLFAALPHDKLCTMANETGDYKYRKLGDDNFYQWARWCGVRSVRAYPMSGAVKGYGNYLKVRGKLK